MVVKDFTSETKCVLRMKEIKFQVNEKLRLNHSSFEERKEKRNGSKWYFLSVATF